MTQNTCILHNANDNVQKRNRLVKRYVFTEYTTYNKLLCSALCDGRQMFYGSVQRAQDQDRILFSSETKTMVSRPHHIDSAVRVEGRVGIRSRILTRDLTRPLNNPNPGRWQPVIWLATRFNTIVEPYETQIYALWMFARR